MMALSRTLFEEVDFDQSMVNSNDWFSYPIMEMEHIPEEIDIHLISDPAEQNPFGAGESSTRIVPGCRGQCFLRCHGRAPAEDPANAGTGAERAQRIKRANLLARGAPRGVPW